MAPKCIHSSVCLLLPAKEPLKLPVVSSVNPLAAQIGGSFPSPFSSNCPLSFKLHFSVLVGFSLLRISSLPLFAI